MSGLRFERLCGADIAARIEALAALRIAVFREWPYLYQGSPAYEAGYLDVYVRSPRSLAVLVWDGDCCVAATTAIPLTEAEDAVQAPFRRQGYPLDRISYFGESVVLREYRGRGLGVKFFELREAHARELGLNLYTFCAVNRPLTHSARPASYVGNDAFWSRRGYRKRAKLSTEFAWTDIGETEPTPKPMVFWLREAQPA